MRHDHINTQEAARLLNMSKRSLERRRNKGNGPIYDRIGRNIYYRIPNIYYWLSKKNWYVVVADIQEVDGPQGKILKPVTTYVYD